MRELAAKRALVTGGGAGIGRAIAQRLSWEGVSVAVIDVDAASASAVADELHGPACSITADVGDPTAPEAMVDEAASQLGGLDIVINNAGVAIPGGVESLEFDAWERVMAVNLRSVWLTSRSAVPFLREAGGGAIVNLTSLQGLRGFAGWTGYATTKGGIISLTQQMAVELGPERIRVNAVAPGTIMTPMNERILADADDPDEVERTWNSLHALGRYGSSEEVAAAVAFLASEDASFITGHCLQVDGGAAILGASTKSQ